jgi:hypothetical protein
LDSVNRVEELEVIEEATEDITEPVLREGKEGGKDGGGREGEVRERQDGVGVSEAVRGWQWHGWKRLVSLRSTSGRRSTK